jgi:sugar/nucleoside kinase (ribokinase family)
VELVGPVAAGATGVVVSVVGADGDRSMASDRGVAPSLEPEELDADWLECDVLHLSGYALLREPISHAALRAVRLARERDARVSVDVAAWTEIRAFGPVRFRELLDSIAPDVLFATEAEWEMLGGAYLTAPTGVIKRGPRGAIVVTEDARLDLAPVAAEVVDTTGAGDALAAGFLLGGSLEEAARRGLEAAARCVARVGSLP